MAEKKRNIVAEALARAKRLESLAPHSKKKILKEYRESLEAAAKLQKLLKPAWYLGKDVHRAKKRKK